MPLVSSTLGHLHAQRSRFYSFLKSRPGLILAKTTALRVLIHATGLTPPGVQSNSHARTRTPDPPVFRLLALPLASFHRQLQLSRPQASLGSQGKQQEPAEPR